MSTAKNAMITLLEQEVKGLTSYLDGDDYSNACDDASRETGWSFPVADGFQTYWVKTRAKRHLFFYLMTESAHKFKFEAINLQHRFEHYKSIIEFMDKQFEEAKEEYAADFTGASAVNLFGTKIDAGFRYEPETGRDQTYDSDTLTNFSPTSSD
jgi:hypothetical protein